MIVFVLASLVSTAMGADLRSPKQQYPSCDLKAQHAIKGQLGGAITDPRQAHIAIRADILQADLGNARTARRLTQATADRLFERIAAIRSGADRYTRRQGFLSAGEVASYDQELDVVAKRLCRR